MKIESYNEKSLLMAGQVWFIKFDDTKCLSEMQISEITKKTVKLFSVNFPNRHSRYKLSDVEFVEMKK